jgi:hypothetical protein
MTEETAMPTKYLVTLQVEVEAATMQEAIALASNMVIGGCLHYPVDHCSFVSAKVKDSPARSPIPWPQSSLVRQLATEICLEPEEPESLSAWTRPYWRDGILSISDRNILIEFDMPEPPTGYPIWLDGEQNGANLPFRPKFPAGGELVDLPELHPIFDDEDLNQPVRVFDGELGQFSWRYLRIIKEMLHVKQVQAFPNQPGLFFEFPGGRGGLAPMAMIESEEEIKWNV